MLQAIDRALVQNFDLLAGAQDVVIGAADVGIARSELLPHVESSLQRQPHRQRSRSRGRRAGTGVPVVRFARSAADRVLRQSAGCVSDTTHARGGACERPGSARSRHDTGNSGCVSRSVARRSVARGRPQEPHRDRVEPAARDVAPRTGCRHTFRNLSVGNGARQCTSERRHFRSNGEAGPYHVESHHERTVGKSVRYRNAVARCGVLHGVVAGDSRRTRTSRIARTVAQILRRRNVARRARNQGDAATARRAEPATHQPATRVLSTGTVCTSRRRSGTRPRRRRHRAGRLFEIVSGRARRRYRQNELGGRPRSASAAVSRRRAHGGARSRAGGTGSGAAALRRARGQSAIRRTATDVCRPKPASIGSATRTPPPLRATTTSNSSPKRTDAA